MLQAIKRAVKRKLLWSGLILVPVILLAITYAFPEPTIRALRTIHVPIPLVVKQHATDKLIARLERRAAAGDCAGQYDLAVQLHKRQFPRQYGIAMQGDARKWLIRSAENGCVDGMTELARYADEAGDYSEAFRWYLKSAELGDPYSEWMIGRYYEEGQGVQQEPDTALQWYKRAANSGYHSERNIASLYAEKQNFIEAHYWYSRALESADAFAAEQLGGCYKYGDDCRGFCDWRNPCPRDAYLAYVWLRVASLYGNCLECYRGIAPLLSPEQISKAEAEASAWIQKHPKRSEWP